MKEIKVLILIILIATISSCKNNNDGYSDEIETSTTPLDTGATRKDTTNINNNSGSPDASRQSTAGTGTGPSASAEDGATYTSESGVQKDSVRIKKDSIKKRKK
ncbi:hypothetical protein [Flavobacterium tistrianum]|uniref:hypothetical protein n=1 Tax=Flavobacterium tistrianum TaxID=1685414 RepID=UPI0013A611C5|nr:hypothetical protein [Flavobacterium tistrianum]KAF2341027.1 hypothetical protein DMB71_11705 [Flavobacterium tistrianum]